MLSWPGGPRGDGEESGVERRESVRGRGGRKGKRERARKRERVCVWRERERVWRERSGQTKKDVNTHTRATKQKRVGIGWFVLWLVVVGVEFSRNCKSPVCEVMNSYDRDNC